MSIKIIEKVYEQKVGNKISWIQSIPYKLGDDNKPFPFEVQILNKQNVVLETKLVNIPASVLQTWSDDTTITNYILASLGLALDVDNTIELLVAKVNENTVNYGDATPEQVVENNLFLKSYIDFVALQIESYKAGDISIEEIQVIEIFATDKVVKITYLDEEFSLLAFVKELISITDKTPVLSGCLASITNAIQEENNPIN